MPLITSPANPAVRDARRIAAGPARARGDAVLVEGPEAVEEALGVLRRLFVTPRAAARRGGLVTRARRQGVEVLQVSEPVLATMAGTVTPQGLLGIADLPSPDLANALGGASLAVILVEVRDPGNVGTVIRTADAAGADVVVLTHGSVDARNPKAVRASAGSLFHLPVVVGAAVEEVFEACRAGGLQTVAATPRAPMTIQDVDLTRASALVFGSEAHGLAAGTIDACDVAASIPIYGRAESLNLAATVAVMAYEAAGQQRSHRAAST